MEEYYGEGSEYSIVIMTIPEYSIETIAFGGTLGDAFIVLCKLYTQHKTDGKHFRLIRYSTRPQMDGVIEDMFKTVQFVEYLTPCQSFNNLDELYQALGNTSYRIVNAKWERGDLETYSFDYEALNPYPIFEISKQNVSRDAVNIGIQLHCGAEGANFRGFSLQWLEEIRRRFPLEGFCVYLFGTGAACYQRTAIDDICRKYGINNLVGKISFAKWLSYMKSMDIFISFEGFSAFFAMSQKVPTILYNQYIYGVNKSLHPVWKENNAVINLNSNIFLRKFKFWKNRYLCRDNLFSPSDLRFVENFICKNTLMHGINQPI